MDFEEYHRQAMKAIGYPVFEGDGTPISIYQPIEDAPTFPSRALAAPRDFDGGALAGFIGESR